MNGRTEKIKSKMISLYNLRINKIFAQNLLKKLKKNRKKIPALFLKKNVLSLD